MNFLPFGTVYGTLLNFEDEFAALAPQMDQPPYKAAPRAPVLYVKTANTWTLHGRPIAVPRHVPEVEVGASVGMVMADARTVGSYVLLNDLSVPHASFFRPPVKFKNLDGFLGVGDAPVPAAQAGDPARWVLTVRINGAVRQQVAFAGLRRDAATLVADVSEFMTLRAGDVLMLGCAAGRPLARAGDTIDIELPGFASLRNTLTEEA